MRYDAHGPLPEPFPLPGGSLDGTVVAKANEPKMNAALRFSRDQVDALRNLDAPLLVGF
jgi:hypothetical protein